MFWIPPDFVGTETIAFFLCVTSVSKIWTRTYELKMEAANSSQHETQTPAKPTFHPRFEQDLHKLRYPGIVRVYNLLIDSFLCSILPNMLCLFCAKGILRWQTKRRRL